MGFFDKWFKRSKDTKEIHKADTADREVDTTNSGADEIHIQEVEPEEPTVETIHSVIEDVPTPNKVKDFKVETKQFQNLDIRIIPVTYENFLESGVFQKFEHITDFTNAMLKYQNKVGSYDIATKDIEEISSSIDAINGKLGGIAEEVSSFREKDNKLRKQIMDYTEVVKQINEKKLAGDEFDKVKGTLEPQINKINQARESFLVEEKIINEKVQTLNQEMVKVYRACQQIVNKLE